MDAISQTLILRLHCLSLPCIAIEHDSVEFGIQDKQQQVHAGRTNDDGSVVFACELTVKADQKTGQPSFFGPFAHGTPGDRFLYLSWKRAATVEAAWVRRLKVPLSGLTWKMIEGVETLEADITERKHKARVEVSWRTGREG